MYSGYMNYFVWIWENIDKLSAAIVICASFLVPLSFVFKRVRDFFTFPKRITDAVDSLRGDVASLREDLNFLGVALSKVVSHLSGKGTMDSFGFGGMKSDLDSRFDTVQTASPMQMTEIGRDLLRDSGLQEIVDTHKDQLIRLLDDALEGCTNRYDIQRLSFSVVDDFLADNKELGGMIKEYAFDKGMNNLREFVRTGGIYLRDLYFEDKNISVEREHVVQDKKREKKV